MFENIGQKLQLWAKISFWVEFGSAIIAGTVMWIEDSDAFWIGLLVTAVGFAAAWFFSALVYGFGELINQSASINRKLGTPSSTPTYSAPVYSAPVSTATPAYSAPAASAADATGWICSYCGRTNPAHCGTCGCGKTKS